MEDRRAMYASLSDVASATSILLAVCLVVLLTLIAICRLLRMGIFSSGQRGGRCSDGTRCGGGRGDDDRLATGAVEGCLPATVPEDDSAASSYSAALFSDQQQYSSNIDLYLIHALYLPIPRQ